MYTRSKTKRRRISQYFERTHLIQGHAQTIQTEQDDPEQLQDAVEEQVERAETALDVATEGETVPMHIESEIAGTSHVAAIIDEVAALTGINRSSARFFRHRHYLPLQPGVITCR